MEKRLILAISLSILVLIVWSAILPKSQVIENKEVNNSITKVATPASSAASLGANTSTTPDFSTAPFNTIALDRMDITFLEPQAAIKKIKFPAYQSQELPLFYGFLTLDKNLVFHQEELTAQKAVFVYSDKDKKIIKRFIFSKSNYIIDLELEIHNIKDTPLEINLPVYLGALDFNLTPAQANFQDFIVGFEDKTAHLKAQKNVTFEKVKFVGLRDKYFCAIIEPITGNYAAFLNKISPKISEIGLTKQALIPGKEKIVEKFLIYLGPQDLSFINAMRSQWSGVIHYGTFDLISQVLLQVLQFLFKLTHNWGWAIVLLSLAIYLVLFPLSLKQMRSMKEMQALQPRILELREMYKDNPQKLNKEIMELYREHKVNPFGGCLPLILQIPVFFALYQALMRSVALKGASFLWIKDLSEPDKLFTLKTNIPIIGNEINLLPVLMMIGMFIQQKLSLGSSSSGSAEQQKMMLVIFPVLFGIIFYHMPAGLVLYWFINSTLMLIYQMRISKTK
jgi:YidC/Oxa1 family membrane protein insertase